MLFAQAVLVKLAKPMLDQINAGKFYDGGAVSEIAGSSENWVNWRKHKQH